MRSGKPARTSSAVRSPSARRRGSGFGDGAGRVRPQRQPLAAVGEHVQADDVVDGLAPRHRVRPARVVADHPAEGAAVVRGRVGAERQPVRRGGVAHGVADHARLDAGGARVRVDLQDPVDVHEVQDDGGVHRLAGDRGPRAHRQHGHVVRPAHRQRRLDVRDVARAHDADRDAAVVRGVGRPHRARGGVEADRAVDGALEVGPQVGDRVRQVEARGHHALSLPGRALSAAPNICTLRLSPCTERLAAATARRDTDHAIGGPDQVSRRVTGRSRREESAWRDRSPGSGSSSWGR